MKNLKLNGWNVAVQRIRIQEYVRNGEPKEVDGWALVFTEVIPQSGDTITFEMNKDVRDYIVRELTGGVVLAGGELPRISGSRLEGV